MKQIKYSKLILLLLEGIQPSVFILFSYTLVFEISK